MVYNGYQPEAGKFLEKLALSISNQQQVATETQAAETERVKVTPEERRLLEGVRHKFQYFNNIIQEFPATA